MAGMTRTVRVARIDARGTEVRRDAAACEEPLEVRLNGRPFAVVMRTPGDDRALAAGFLFAERVVRSAGELADVKPCVSGRAASACNAVDVRLARGVATRVEGRRVTTNSSCGLCGRATIQSLQVDAPRIEADWTVDPSVLRGLPETLRAAQDAFNLTGGLHAAGLFARDGRLLDVAEDVGRHNAVDKIVGRALLAGRLPLADAILFVSGRTSFEIVQKAFLAGVPVVAAVSAPTSLAVDLAEASGITLAGFVRDGAFNAYAHDHRIAPGGAGRTATRGSAASARAGAAAGRSVRRGTTRRGRGRGAG